MESSHGQPLQRAGLPAWPSTDQRPRLYSHLAPTSLVHQLAVVLLGPVAPPLHLKRGILHRKGPGKQLGALQPRLRLHAAHLSVSPALIPAAPGTPHLCQLLASQLAVGLGPLDFPRVALHLEVFVAFAAAEAENLRTAQRRAEKPSACALHPTGNFISCMLSARQRMCSNKRRVCHNRCRLSPLPPPLLLPAGCRSPRPHRRIVTHKRNAVARIYRAGAEPALLQAH